MSIPLSQSVDYGAVKIIIGIGLIYPCHVMYLKRPDQLFAIFPFMYVTYLVYSVDFIAIAVISHGIVKPALICLLDFIVIIADIINADISPWLWRLAVCRENNPAYGTHLVYDDDKIAFCEPNAHVQFHINMSSPSAIPECYGIGPTQFYVIRNYSCLAVVFGKHRVDRRLDSD